MREFLASVAYLFPSASAAIWASADIHSCGGQDPVAAARTAMRAPEKRPFVHPSSIALLSTEDGRVGDHTRGAASCSTR